VGRYSLTAATLRTLLWCAHSKSGYIKNCVPLKSYDTLDRPLHWLPVFHPGSSQYHNGLLKNRLRRARTSLESDPRGSWDIEGDKVQRLQAAAMGVKVSMIGTPCDAESASKFLSSACQRRRTQRSPTAWTNWRCCTIEVVDPLTVRLNILPTICISARRPETVRRSRRQRSVSPVPYRNNGVPTMDVSPLGTGAIQICGPGKKTTRSKLRSKPRLFSNPVCQSLSVRHLF